MMGEQKRGGFTKTTSVSVSKEFSDILLKLNISPTEVFRMGMGVMLYEFGDPNYLTEKNKKRYEEAKRILKSFEDIEKIMDKLREIKEAIQRIENVIEGKGELKA